MLLAYAVDWFSAVVDAGDGWAAGSAEVDEAVWYGAVLYGSG